MYSIKQVNQADPGPIFFLNNPDPEFWNQLWIEYFWPKEREESFELKSSSPPELIALNYWENLKNHYY